ncbi:MAG: sugar phosphate isomerase/epimerase [Ruminococcaceae bacterium]|nr:sugar phosphate isomerase/epimerase [Oscillospiraceae bacterium]
MKISVTSYSFGSYINEDKLGLMGIIDKAAEMGFEGIEFSSGAWSQNLNPDVALAIKERCAEKGIACIAYLTGANFLNPDLDAEIAALKKAVDFTAAMGAPMMRHDVAWNYDGAKKHSRGYDNALEVIVPAIREVTEYAASKGVKTMTENHGYFSQDAARVEKLINTVANDNFGALVDLGNFMCADEDPVKSVSIMAPYAIHVHAKDFLWKSGMEINPGEGWFQTRAKNYLRGAIIGHGVANIYQSVQILKSVGYDGYITVEFEGAEDNLKGIRIGRDNLMRFIG